VTYLHSSFEKYESQSNNLLKYIRRIISIIASSNSGDNPKKIYEYDIDSETIKIKKLLFKLASKADKISWIQNAISELDYFLNIIFE
jgi:hypothetical protein